MADPQSYADSSYTPASIASRRRLAEAMMQQGLESGPIRHWAQGAGRLAQAMVGGYGAYRADEDERKGLIDLGRTLAGTDDVPNNWGATVRPATPSAAVAAPTPGPAQPRSVRNNNPGNIEYGPFAQRAGATGSDGRFAQFPDMGAGYGAMDRLLGNYAGQGRNTVSSIVERWAPRAVDNNATDAYIAAVSRQLGVEPNTPLTAEQMPRVAEAMARFEAGRPVPRPDGMMRLGGPRPEDLAGAPPAMPTADQLRAGVTAPFPGEAPQPQPNVGNWPVVGKVGAGRPVAGPLPIPTLGLEAGQRPPQPPQPGAMPVPSQMPTAEQLRPGVTAPMSEPPVDADAIVRGAEAAQAARGPAPAAPVSVGAPDAIRRLLRSNNPQAVMFGVQLYKDLLRAGRAGDFDFQAVEGTLYRVNKRTGEAAIVAGTGQGRPPEAIRTQAIKADQAYQSISTMLDDYQNLVQRTGAIWGPGQNNDAVTQARRNIQLQLKELYNLGVLNGPDLDLMNQVLVDPTVGLGSAGLPNMLPGNAAQRVSASVTRLKEMLRTLRNTQTSAVGLPPVGPAAGGWQTVAPGVRIREMPAEGDGGYRVLGVR
jgi:hypothetical protein